MTIWDWLAAAVNFGVLFWLVWDRNVSRANAAMAAAGAIAVTLLHISTGGWRWQMVPIYIAALLALGCCFSGRARRSSTRRRLVMAVQSLALFVFAGVSIALPLLMPVFSFVSPNGPYAVGTTVYHWVDENRSEPYSDNPEDRRELMVQVWYPAGQAEGKRSPYTRYPKEVAAGLGQTFSLPGFVFSHLENVVTHSHEEGKLAAGEERFPVLLFSHGLTGFRNQNTFEVEELASHGYIVIGIDHTYDAAATVFPDGRAALIRFANLSGFTRLDEHIELWKGDIRFVLDMLERLDTEDDRFAGRMDLVRIGMFGHSYGGATAVQTLMEDERIKAAINMDGTLYGDVAPESGVGKPLFIMSAEQSVDKELYDKMAEVAAETTGRSREDLEQSWQETVRRRERALSGGGFSIVIPNTSHMSFTDFHLFSPLLKNKGEDPRSVHRMINDFSLAFFDLYVKKLEGARETLDSVAAKYKEANFTAHP
ncbi:alpha/beta hydrolase family protein [Paenibacillus sp. SAFN-117]|uniref:alpha/beta hydrolase family protein n=1 Tax=Paenibacillus sp. SAFN-117 TaxID=3436860 RepID=UPI003F7FDA73